ncbi:serine protease [Streptomyces sp. YIM 98790]|uniref:S1 family peptidase n=1 Tax=Streptomyces sp. YIM 98790 TaxID=2689077 RepID=UPI001408C924|nr:serine protease [Streptomyces sp. YIM 98790]
MPAARDPWRVRIRSPRSGEVIGSGVLLGGDTVLTCAHVLPGRDAPVTVEFPEIEGAAGSPATVREGCWHPAREDRADLALLTVHSPPPGRPSAPLVRAAPAAGLSVELCGYSEAVMQGRGAAFGATVSRTFGERVQLNPAQAHLPRHGFSGGPVLDMGRPTGVLGITVTAYLDRAGAAPLMLAHMIPVDTVIRYLPEVKRWARGRHGVEPGLATTASATQRVDADYAARLARWLSGRDPAPVYATEITPGSVRERTVQRALALADRELSPDRPVVVSSAPPETIPPVGSLDLAVHAAGRTAEEVARRIAERVRLRAPEEDGPPDRTPDRPDGEGGGDGSRGSGGNGPAAGARELLRGLRLSLTVAVLGMNRAATPAELVELCGELAERDCRLLLVWDGGSTAARRAARESVRLRHRIGRITARLRELDTRIEHLPPPAAADPPDTAPRAVAAQLWVDLAAYHGAHRTAGGRPPVAQLHRALDRLSGRIGALEERIRAAQDTAGRLRARRAELRRELDTYRQLAAGLLHAEHIGLHPLYEAAREALYGPPLGPDTAGAAAEAVARYTAAVRRALGWPPAEEAP